MLAVQGAAPAVVPRKRNPGTPRVTVRSYYGEPPFGGLDAGRMNAGESLRDQGGRSPLSGPGSSGPGVQSRRCGALGGARPPQGAQRRKASLKGSASWRSAPSDFVRGKDRDEGHRGARKTAADPAWLFDN
jgi:hypothetical protein